jgi:electron transport complex protein RnfG
MSDMIKMVVVLTILSAFSGGLLAAVRNGTLDRIENQQLQFVKGPAIKAILEGASNDPISDRFKLPDGDAERSFFVGKFDGKANTVALESYGKGYGGDVGVMVGINVEENKLVGVGVTTHAETPGMGARAKEDPSFVAQFKGLSIQDPIKVTQDGGQINALSGATITSKAVSAATTEATEIFKRLKPQIEEKLKEMQ